MDDKLRKMANQVLDEKANEAFILFCKRILKTDDKATEDEIESVRAVFCTGFKTGYSMSIIEEIKNEEIDSAQYAHFNTDIH